MIEIVKENFETVTIVVSKDFQDLVTEHKIFTRPQDESCRWQIGSHVTFGKNSLVEPYVGIYRGEAICTIGSFTYTHSPLAPSLKIGRYCSIAAGLQTIGARHTVESLSTSPAFYDKNTSFSINAARDLGFDIYNIHRLPNDQKPPPEIQNDVWIASNCFINAGVIIGNGSVIARASVVTKNVDAYGMMGGNPAKKIRTRFPQDLADRLLNTEWWRHSPAQLEKGPKHDPEKFSHWYQENKISLNEFSPEPLQIWNEVRRLA